MEGPESTEGLEDIEVINVETVELVTDSCSGLHNLIVGDKHSYASYASYGGTVTGKKKKIMNKCSAVVGGWDNIAKEETFSGDWGIIDLSTVGNNMPCHGF